MSTFSKSCFFLAFFFACICYAVCSFFFDTKYTIMLSLFTGAIFYIVFSIFDRHYSKKAVNSLDELVILPCGGTPSSFFFVDVDEKYLEPTPPGQKESIFLFDKKLPWAYSTNQFFARA